MAERSVFIRRDGEGFGVSVEPPLEVDFNKFCETAKRARGFASMVGKLRVLPVVDETGEVMG